MIRLFDSKAEMPQKEICLLSSRALGGPGGHRERSPALGIHRLLRVGLEASSPTYPPSSFQFHKDSGEQETLNPETFWVEPSAQQRGRFPSGRQGPHRLD